MPDPLSILGATAASLQIVGLICQLGIQILKMRKDGKSLKDIAHHSEKYVSFLERWEGEMDGEAKEACKELKEMLLQIIAEINELSIGSTTKK